MEFERIADKKRVDFIVASIRKSFPAGGEILDIGCGNGMISRAIGAFGYDVKGIDVSEKTIAVAMTDNTLPNVHFEVVAAGKLTIEHLKYDAIVCSEVLEHLHRPEELLNIIHDSLKNDGSLIVTVPNGRGPRELLVTRPVQYLQRKNGFAWKLASSIKKSMGYTGTTVQSAADDLSHIQFFTSKDLTALATATHFKIDIIKPSNFIEQVFPFSLLVRRSRTLQKLDCRIAEALPLNFTSGFMTVWKKNKDLL
jgi:2-polyprenyl-3-methyl-5-hydroxy-6-metoxy-1,4-benzoquinol methylase